MMGGGEHTVSAVRRNDGTIEYYYAKRTKKPLYQKMKKIPILRGVIALIESAANGSKHLQFASDRYDVTPGEEVIEEKKPEGSGKLSLWLGVAAIGVLSFLFGKFLFTMIPVFIAQLFSGIFESKTEQIILESFFKLLLLLTYIYLVSLTPLIKRVFQYHGSEHKVINCYENGEELTIANVQKQSRLHYRCGSSFMLFTVIVGMIVYFFVPIDPFWLRIVDRLLLIPVVLGLSFEVLQATNACRNIPVLRFLGYPGLWLQLLTTKEPSDDQVEVAIASFNKLKEVETNPEVIKEMHI
ncbi:DUF1385 domain-containing protein [Kurthia sibirica]|uniref:DUF1385 domain-containing protein n=2 Tax=Kurthia sibirica TaxID=202750 RepID=A0A2U3AM14_9BACL|nr:DUF1385 domain-containing protein [Kurthia sibirica]